MQFPKPHRLGPRCVRWKISELETWEKSRQEAE
ncbi:helix-turn-helix transcriptional regulator [Sansalvadorimonas verongulae]